MVTAGKPVPGAVVNARQGGQSWTTVTDEDGRFTLEGLPAGVVNLDVRMFGFQL